MVAAEERVSGAVGGQWLWPSSLRDGGRNALEMPSKSRVLVPLQGKEAAFIQLCRHGRELSKSPKLSQLF